MKASSARMVGLFVIGAVALTVALVLTFASGRLFARPHTFVTYFQQSVAGLDVGAPVEFMGVRVGTVRSISLSLNDQGQRLEDFRVPVVFEVDERLLVQRGLIELSLDDRTQIESLIQQGLRVEMGVESFVTGKKYLGLVVRPDAPPTLVNDPAVAYFEIPSARTSGLEDLESEVQQALGRFVRLELDSLLLQMNRTLQSLERVASQDVPGSLDRIPATLVRADSTLMALQRLANRMEEEMDPFRSAVSEALEDADATSAELRATLTALRGVAGPESTLLARMEEVLDRLSAAGSAVETLADFLARNPDALLRGRPAPQR